MQQLSISLMGSTTRLLIITCQSSQAGLWAKSRPITNNTGVTSQCVDNYADLFECKPKIKVSLVPYCMSCHECCAVGTGGMTFSFHYELDMPEMTVKLYFTWIINVMRRTLTIVKIPQFRWPPRHHSHPPAGSRWKPRRWCLRARPAPSTCSRHCCCNPGGNWGW